MSSRNLKTIMMLHNLRHILRHLHSQTSMCFLINNHSRYPAYLKLVKTDFFCFSAFTNALIGLGQFGPLEKVNEIAKLQKNVENKLYIPIKKVSDCSQQFIKVIVNNTI